MHVNGNHNADNKDEFQLQITISDTGKGIDKDLGESFFKNTQTHQKNSVGLGLTISKG
jgi:nitrogen-specific signal transduction histidine kinase